MAYATGDTILDTHYNDFATSVNALWGTGTSDRGYGETGTTVATVSDGTTITATQWVTLLARINSMASHQGSSITSITNPSATDTIEAYTALSTNISTIDTNRLNVATRQSVANTNRDNTNTFTGTLTFTHKWAWGSEDQARYFFNSGGRLSISGSQSGHGSDNKGNQWANLLTQAGTFYIYAQSSGKSGGSGSPSTNNTNAGYYDINTTLTSYFLQYEDTGPYTANYVQWRYQLADSNASVNASCLWVDAAADQTSYNKSIYNVQDQVEGTHRMTFGYEKHDTTYVADNGGTITVTGSATHSSDIRLKTNIQKLDVVEGLQTYMWNYTNGIEGTFSGVMAQDLLGTQYEDALLVDEAGYYRVDYNKLPVDCVKH